MEVYISCKSKYLEKAITCELTEKGVSVFKLNEGENVPLDSCTIIESSMLSSLKLPEESDMSNLIVVGYEEDFEFINIDNYYRKLLRPFDMDEMCQMIFKDEHSNPLLIPISVNLLDKIKIDNDKRTISLYGNSIKLSKKQFALFCYLFDHKGTPCSRNDIFSSVWPEGASDIYVVDTYICYLRKRIETSLGYPKILNMRNQGYMIE